ncbi:MAG TPA: acyltransferase [Actinomycetota bacterium]|nr:acyltransferase [Actinomycetota bacterium]
MAVEPPRERLADEGVILGHPSARVETAPLRLGSGARLRSGTVIYAGSVIGDGFQTGHNVVVREENRIGDDVSVWSNSIVDYGCVIGNRVKIHSNCYVAQFTELEDDVFLAPGVTIANDLFPGNPQSARAMAGPRICAGAQVGAGTVILPYLTIGAGAIVGAGSVVTRDVPPRMIAYGSPARPARPVDDTEDVSARVRAERERRFSVRGIRLPRSSTGH